MRRPKKALPPVLDACCGSRMFWFDKHDPRALGIDIRSETCVADTREGRRVIEIRPDLVADFRSMPFPSDTFNLVVFDPPHTFAGSKGWTSKTYGTLREGWKADFAAGFRECFRVLKTGGTLVFKWHEHRVPLRSVLALCPVKPLFGHRSGKAARTHWVCFIKTEEASHAP